MGRGLPPAYIFSIGDDRVRMSGDLNPVFHMLKECKYRDRVIRESPNVLAVKFAPLPHDLLANKDLHTVLTWLTNHGVAFSPDHSHDRSALDLGLELQNRGLLPKRITIIDWASQDQWKVREVFAHNPTHRSPAPEVH